MVLRDAYERAESYLDEQIRKEHEWEIVIDSCEDLGDAWAFGYNTRPFLEEDDISSALAGNGPVIVPKSGDCPYIGPIFPM